MPSGYDALRQGVAWLDLSARGRIAMRGRDRARLLHSVSSNEVKALKPGDTRYAFLLTPKGRIEADFNLLCRADDFLLDTEPELREKVRAHIRRYVVADQVELEDITEETAAIGVEGPEAEGIREAAGVDAPGFTVAPFTITGQPGYRIYCPRAEAAGVIERLEKAGAVPADAEEARAVRIENGKPRYGEDIRENSLPQETQQMQAVSFTKGCYIGQEIVERIRAQGHVNRKLVRVEVEGPEPLTAGSKLTAAGQEAGEVTSSAWSPGLGKVVALAILRAALAEADTALDAGGRAAVVR